MVEMRKSLYRLITPVWLKLDFLCLKTFESLNKLFRVTGILQEFEKVFMILSVDAESDLYTHKTFKAGWEVGVPYILDIFSECGTNGRACWLIEYNVRDGLVLCNPSCNGFVPNYEDVIRQIKQRGYEFGLHPAMYAYARGQWNHERAWRDPTFVFDVIHQGTEALVSVCRERPVGCRTGNFHFALGLAKALEHEGYLIDSSDRKMFWEPTVAPNAWFAEEKDYRLEKTVESRTRVLEISTTDSITATRKGLFSLNYKPNLKKPHSSSNILFLSTFFHNWDAVRQDGKVNPKFRDAFDNFWAALVDNGVKVVSFSEAYRIYKKLTNRHLNAND